MNKEEIMKVDYITSSDDGDKIEECGHCQGKCIMDEYVTTTGG